MLNKCVAVLLACVAWASSLAADLPADLRKAVWAKRSGKWQVIYTHVSVPPKSE